MKTAIIYQTKHGYAEKCAKSLKEGICCETELFDLGKKGERPDLDQFSMVILGGSVYAGKLQKEILDYWEANKEKLLEKKIALFSCNMTQGEENEKQLSKIFPEEILAKSFCTLSLGGKFDFSKLNFLEKMIVKKVAKVESDQENVQSENIKLLTEKINELCC